MSRVRGKNSVCIVKIRKVISMFTNFFFRLAPLLCAALLLAGCSTFASRGNTGVVVSRRAQIRSSTAVVAADLLEVSRGDSVEILDSTEVPDPTDNSRNELWYRV